MTLIIVLSGSYINWDITYTAIIHREKEGEGLLTLTLFGYLVMTFSGTGMFFSTV